jgi:trimeric autotransporter adhesin
VDYIWPFLALAQIAELLERSFKRRCLLDRPERLRSMVFSRAAYMSVLASLMVCIGCGQAGSNSSSSTPSVQTATITSISPTSVQVGAAATTLQINGSNFVSGSAVTFSGAQLTTTFNSATSLSAVIPAASLEVGETAEIAVVNPGAAASGSISFSVDNPLPVLNSVSPNTAVVGTSVAVSLGGTGFVSASMVQLNGTTVASSFVGTTSLNVNLTPAELSQAGTGQLTVINPAPAGGASAPANLKITQPLPTLSSVSAAYIPVGSPDTSLTLAGSDFSPTAVVTANGTQLSVISQSATSITATLPASAIARAGTIALIVTNPGVNPESSNQENVMVVGTPTISGLSPAGTGIGGPDLTLTVIGSNFAPNSVVDWNGIALATSFGSSNQLTASVPAADIASFGNSTVTVSTAVSSPATPGTLVSAAQPFSTYLSLTNNDLVYNPKDGYLYASVPSSVTGTLGNTVVSIDPLTGNLVRQIAVGSNPNQIAISDDGTQLFVGLDGAAAVRQVNLTTGQPGLQFSLGGGSGVYNPPFTAAALAVLPGEPNSVAVLDISGILRVFDSGVARANTSLGLLDTYFDQNSGALSFGPSASTLYANALPFAGIEILSIDSTGVTGARNLAASGSSGQGGIQYENGSIYVSNGTVLNGTTGAVLGTFSAATNQAAVGPVVSDSAQGFAFVAFSADSILAFNERSFLPTGSIPVTGLAGTFPAFQHIVRWGQDGVAVSTPTQIYVFQSPLVKDLSGSPADVAVALSAPATATTGSPLSWTATVSNNGPNQAQGIVLTSPLPVGLIVQSVTPSQGSCSAAGAVNCDLGSLASGSNATVTALVVPSTAGSFQTTATVSSVSFDPTASNNQATTSTMVAGALYSPVPSVSGISPALVAAGSGFTLTVTGSGFTANSTVQINGVAQPTTLVSNTELTASVVASTVANYGWAAVTVSNAAPGGGISQVSPLTIYAVVYVPANRILFDPFTRRLYATLPSTSPAPLTGNSVVSIDPVTAAVDTPISVGSEPNLMAETSDGNYLWVGLSGSDSLGRFNLVNQQLEATIPLDLTQSLFGNAGPIPAYGLSAMPGSDTTLAVDVTNLGEAAIFDVSGSTGAFRPNIPIFYTGNNPVFASPTEIYTYDNFTSGAEFYRFSVNSQGLTQIDGSTMYGLGGGTTFPFAVANGIVYGASGGIVDPTTTPPTQIATLSTLGYYGAGVAPDPATAKDFLVLENLPGTFTSGIFRYDTNQYVAEAQLPLPATSNGGELGYDIVRWGQDGLAIRSYESGGAALEILLLRGPFVLPSELNVNPAPSVTGASQTSLAVNSGNAMLTLSGSGFLPGAVALWSGSPRSTTFVSPSQLIVAIASADLAAAGSATITVQNPGSLASGPVTITVQ